MDTFKIAFRDQDWTVQPTTTVTFTSYGGRFFIHGGFSPYFPPHEWPFGRLDHNFGHIQGHPKVGKGSSALIYKIPLSSSLAELTIDAIDS
jgi:hypothetical protein